MITISLSLVAGLALLILGANGLFVVAVIWVLDAVFPLVIGLTIVAFGTSAPELAVSLRAALEGQTDISLANVVGSNIANIGLILGLTALIKPITVDVRLIRYDIPLMILVSIILILMMLDAVISRLDGILLFAAIIAITWFNVSKAKAARQVTQQRYEETLRGKHNSLKLDLGLILAGLILLPIGAQFFLQGAVDLARLVGLSEAVIGLTIVAVGTSLPELAASLTAARKNMGDIAVGNVVGSNIFNICCVLGITALLHPLPMGNIDWTDMAVLLMLTVAVLPAAIKGKSLNRWEGGLMLFGYCGYTLWLIQAAS